MAKGTYGYIAINDLYSLYNIKLAPFGSYAAIMHGIAEKLFKHVISAEYPPSGSRAEILKTHNLQKLVDFLNAKYGIGRRYFKNLSGLSSTYFDLRYPGDSYIDVDKDGMNEYIECLNDILLWFVSRCNIELLHDLNCEVNKCKRLCDDNLEDTKDNRKMLANLLNIHPIDLLS